jgi:hypothetical protein
MKFRDIGDNLPDAMVTQDMTTATETAEARLQAIEDRLKETSLENQERLRLELEKSRVLTELDKKSEAWDIARRVFDSYMEMRDFEGAVDACDALFMTEQDDSLAALGMGVWLGVTYPIDPELSIGMLQHIIDETPDDADGAAVAAATAHYIADLRATEKQHEKLVFFTNQMMGNVARRHSQVENQDQFDFWLEKLELDDPSKFLVRLRNVVDVLVQENWWFDREALQSELPDQ